MQVVLELYNILNFKHLLIGATKEPNYLMLAINIADENPWTRCRRSNNVIITRYV